MDPVTVPQAGGHSEMSMITFKSWDVRSSFLRRFGGQSGTPLYHTVEQPVAGRHVKVSPCAPQWQRKLEAPLRVVLSAVNAHEDWQGMTLTILWKSLTVMKPSQERDFIPDHTAWARLFYEEKEGVFRGRLEVAQELANLLLSHLGPKRHIHSADAVLLLFMQAHLTNTFQALFCQGFCTLQQCLLADAACRRAWPAWRHRAATPRGPVSLLWPLVSEFQWTWPSPFTLRAASGDLKLLTLKQSAVAHQLLEAARL